MLRFDGMIVWTNRTNRAIAYSTLSIIVGLFFHQSALGQPCNTCYGEGDFSIGSVTACCEGTTCFTFSSPTSDEGLCAALSPPGTFSLDEIELELSGDDCLDNVTTGPSDPIIVRLRVWEPTSPAVFRGTIVFGSGGGGATWLSDEISGMEKPVARLMKELAETGFRVIDRRWDEGGWTSTSYGFRLEASRYATLLKWIYSKYDCGANNAGAFIVVGQSGGSGEVAHGLMTTSYGLSEFIDLAFLLSGPPFTRLDQQCALPIPDTCTPDWGDECDSLFCTYQPTGADWAGVCTTSSTACGTTQINRPRCVFDPLPDPQRESSCTGACAVTSPPTIGLLNDSILHDGNPGLILPECLGRTRVHMILGLQDTTEAPAGGLSLYDHIQSRKHLEYVNGPHGFISGSELAHRRVVAHAIEFWSRPFVGDVTRDGTINNSDRDIINDQIDDPSTDGYFSGDVNNDGDVTIADRTIAQNNQGKSLAACALGTGDIKGAFGNCFEDQPVDPDECTADDSCSIIVSNECSCTGSPPCGNCP